MARDKKVPSLWAFSKDKFTYDTIQDMKNDTGLTEGIVVTCTGGITKEDGNNRQYIIYPETEIAMFNDVQLNNGKTAKWIPKYQIQSIGLTNGTDLNDVIIAGFYAHQDPSIKIVNSPFPDIPMYLEVMNLKNDSKNIIQKATDSLYGEVATRMRINLLWTGWFYTDNTRVMQVFRKKITTPKDELNHCRNSGIYWIETFNTVFPNQYPSIHGYGFLEVFKSPDNNITQVYRPHSTVEGYGMWVIKRTIGYSGIVMDWIIENASYLL